MTGGEDPLGVFGSSINCKLRILTIMLIFLQTGILSLCSALSDKTGVDLDNMSRPAFRSMVFLILFFLEYFLDGVLLSNSASSSLLKRTE